MGPYKITMRLDFCGNRATSRGRVICCIRSLLLFFPLRLFFFFFFFSFLSVAGSEQVQPFQRIVDRTTNYGTIILYHLTRRLSFHQSTVPLPVYRINRAFSFSLVRRFRLISLLLHFLRSVLSISPRI